MFTVVAKGMKSLELYFRNEKRAQDFANRMNVKKGYNMYTVRPLTVEEMNAIH